jgi:hypothetical protein
MKKITVEVAKRAYEQAMAHEEEVKKIITPDYIIRMQVARFSTEYWRDKVRELSGV